MDGVLLGQWLGEWPPGGRAGSQEIQAMSPEKPRGLGLCAKDMGTTADATVTWHANCGGDVHTHSVTCWVTWWTGCIWYAGLWLVWCGRS